MQRKVLDEQRILQTTRSARVCWRVSVLQRKLAIFAQISSTSPVWLLPTLYSLIDSTAVAIRLQNAKCFVSSRPSKKRLRAAVAKLSTSSDSDALAAKKIQIFATDCKESGNAMLLSGKTRLNSLRKAARATRQLHITLSTYIIDALVSTKIHFVA